ncbi:HNM1-choline permease [Fusarium mexicanum]|uniref:HNM1-choline permease n=1 Tax=Fusarium mexicanum TaxID=751941 RepID=A0A8H5IEK4_9HYPO|nr:HNM1-choline permease [Fusarium mexicanum]
MIKDLGIGQLLSMLMSESVPGSKLIPFIENAGSEHALVTLPLTDFELQINMSLDMASPAIDNEKHLGSQNQDEQNLERHGYVQQTKRNFSLTAMVATCVNLMATWEALSSTLAAGLVSGGAVSLVYGVIVAFVGSLCSASSLAELASSYPTAGGQYHFVAKLSPKTSRPLTSWFAGYISTLGWIASAGSAPFLAGTQIQGLLVLNYPDSYVFQRWHGTLLFWAVLLGSACICIFCSNKLPLIEKLTLVLHVTFFIAIIVTMAVTSPTKHSAEWVFSHFENNSGWGNDAVAWSIGLLSSCYVLIGYDGATHLSEEMNNAEMGVPRAMVGCLVVNGPLGFAFLLVILFFMGDISAALATPTGFPIIEIFLHMTGSVAAATTMTAMITVMACLSTVPLLTAAARIMWAFARDQGLPFAERIASVDKRRQIPTVSIIVVSFLLMLLSLINIGSTTAFNAILSLAVVSLQASYLLPIILLIWRRLFRPDTLRWGPWRLGKAGLPINIIAVIYLIYTCIFLLFPPYQPITPVNMNYAPVVLGGALKLKCDEAEPACARCVKSNLLCPGYKRPVKWSTKYEIDYGIHSYAGPSSGHSPGSDASPSSQSDTDKALMLYSPQEESSKLLTHYFTSACQVLSSFDSPNNPYRSDLLEFIRNSPIVFNSALSASAAHLSQQEHDTSLIPLTFQTEAISHISRELAEMNVTQNVLAPLRNSTPPTIKDDLMLGIALIGMTSSWHDPSYLGLCHFHGARQVFGIWMNQFDLMDLQLPSHRIQRLIASSMVYWEVMASCLIDQEVDALSYLDVFSNLPPTTFCYPCPWTGVGTNILIRVAKCMTIVRQKRLLSSYNYSRAGDTDLSTRFLDLLTQAFTLSLDIDHCQIPTPEAIQSTGDYRTPSDHLCKIAKCYQLVARLELDRAFPELTQCPQDDLSQDTMLSQHILELAVKILEIMNTIPEDSRTIAIQTIIFLTAGSALGSSKNADTNIKVSIAGWRRFVLERLHKSFLSLKLQTINRAATMLQKVWSRMDSAAMEGPESISCDKSPVLRVHWIDVMTEAGLETILG